MAMIHLNRDFKEFLQLLNDHEVKYLIVGGFAVIYHGYVRTTGDIDIWVELSDVNAKKLSLVLQDFGFSSDNANEDLFLNENKVLQFGIVPHRIDIMMSIAGLEFEPCYANRIIDSYDDITFSMLSFEDLKTNKKASGRLKDLTDLDYFSKQ